VFFLEVLCLLIAFTVMAPDGVQKPSKHSDAVTSSCRRHGRDGRPHVGGWVEALNSGYCAVTVMAPDGVQKPSKHSDAVTFSCRRHGRDGRPHVQSPIRMPATNGHAG